MLTWGERPAGCYCGIVSPLLAEIHADSDEAAFAASPRLKQLKVLVYGHSLKDVIDEDACRGPAMQLSAGQLKSLPLLRGSDGDACRESQAWGTREAVYSQCRAQSRSTQRGGQHNRCGRSNACIQSAGDAAVTGQCLLLICPVRWREHAAPSIMQRQVLHICSTLVASEQLADGSSACRLRWLTAGCNDRGPNPGAGALLSAQHDAQLPGLL